MAAALRMECGDRVVDGTVEVLRAGEGPVGEVVPLQVAPDPTSAPRIWRHIEPFDEAPDQTNPVILRHQFVEAECPPFSLSALGTTQSRQPAAQPLRRNVIRQGFEQPSHFIRRHRTILARTEPI